MVVTCTNVTVPSATTAMLSLDEVLRLVRNLRRKEDDQLLRFNQTMQSQRCPVCGYAIRTDGNSFRVCRHQYHAMVDQVPTVTSQSINPYDTIMGMKIYIADNPHWRATP